MFGGFDFSLSNLGQTLQQLKDDVESSIDQQLRADRLGLVPESQNAAKDEEGGRQFTCRQVLGTQAFLQRWWSKRACSADAGEGWGFEALGSLANAVLVSAVPFLPQAGPLCQWWGAHGAAAWVCLAALHWWRWCTMGRLCSLQWQQFNL